MVERSIYIARSSQGQKVGHRGGGAAPKRRETWVCVSGSLMLLSSTCVVISWFCCVLGVTGYRVN